MVVGDAMGGKTSAIMALKGALTDLANAGLMDSQKVLNNFLQIFVGTASIYLFRRRF